MVGRAMGDVRHAVVRMDWGPVGARAAAVDACVVVDVLSFSTSVGIATGRGARVYPYPWADDGAPAFAAERGAVLAQGRSAPSARAGTAPSLSPAALTRCPLPSRLVLPSPNGSAISAALAGSGVEVAAGCLRNATAVAAWLRVRLQAGRSVAVVAAGERWGGDDSLRPAVEDLLGAGAVLSRLRRSWPEAGFTPEALVAAGAFDAVEPRLAELLADCVSGVELAGPGFADDVTEAARLDVSDTVPVLVDGAFVAKRPSSAAAGR